MFLVLVKHLLNLLKVAYWSILYLEFKFQTPGSGIMKLLNPQLSTDGQFDWSKMHRRPIKLSVSAYLQV